MRRRFLENGTIRGRSTTVERALEILLLFADQPVLTVPALGQRLGLTKSTAYRFVSGLRHRGFLDGFGDGRYRLGPRILQLAEAARQQLGVVDLALPVMMALSESTRETTLLTTVAGDQALAVRQVAAPQPIRLTFQPGVARPLHAGASAKILFAYVDERHRERLLRTGRFDRRTPRTVTDPARLRQQLAEIRARGYAVTTGEYEDSLRAIAAPVMEPNGCVWGLSVVGPISRMSDERLPRLIRAVVEAARTLTGRVGGSSPTRAGARPAAAASGRRGR